MNTLVVVEVVLVALISVKVMMVVEIVVVNCGREDGGGDVVSVYISVVVTIIIRLQRR